MMKKIVVLLFAGALLYGAQESFYYKSGHKITLTPVQTTLRAGGSFDYYETSQGRVVGVNDEILLKLKDPKQIQTLLERYNLELVKQYGSSLFLVRTPSKQQTLSLANQLYLEKDVVFAHPNLLQKRMRR